MEKERKHQIIRAAIKRFSKHGLKKTTLEEVARDLRIGKATIYHYFSSKEELYFECLALETRLFIEELHTLFNSDTINTEQKFADYFLLKEAAPEKFRLLFSAIIEDMNGTLFENEKNLLSGFITDEIAAVSLFLNSIYINKGEPAPPYLPHFLVNHSWALLFSALFTGLNNKESSAHQKELLLNMLSKVIPFPPTMVV